MLPRSLAVVGAGHPNKRGPARRFEIAVCAPGEPINLRLEPRNKADKNAVAVYSCREVQLGYLSAERAPFIGAQIRAGRELSAVFQYSTDWGCVIRIAYDGEEPRLDGLPTEPPKSADLERDWWPDDIPPD